VNVTLNGRMGGPETGVRCLAAIVMLRPKLKAALAPLAVPGLATLDITLWLGGSISACAGPGVEASAKYYAKKETLNVVISVPRAEVDAMGDAATPEAIAACVAQGLEQMPLSAAARALDLQAMREAIREVICEVNQPVAHQAGP